MLILRIGYVRVLKIKVSGMDMAKYICVICGYVYDESKGDPENNIAPNTLWADVPDDWVCPDCGVTKDDFDLIEE